jgi:hypothetical protein
LFSVSRDAFHVPFVFQYQVPFSHSTLYGDVPDHVMVQNFKIPAMSGAGLSQLSGGKPGLDMPPQAGSNP